MTDRLRRLHGQGLSASQIGARLGVSRSAVLGKLWRQNAPARAAGRHRRRPATEAEGTPQGRQLHITIGFPPDVFDTLNARAIASGRSFASEVRALVDAALVDGRWGDT